MELLVEELAPVVAWVLPAMCHPPGNGDRDTASNQDLNATKVRSS